MRFVLICIGFTISGFAAVADVVVPTRTLRAGHVIGPSDIVLKPGETVGAMSDIGLVLGTEARVALYAGRPIKEGDVGPPALVDRNAYVRLIFNRGGLEIVAEGRALGRGSVGDMVRVMNLASRATMMGQVRMDGSIIVGRK